MSWPRLPSVVQGLAGPIRVDRPVQVAGNLWGHWRPGERRILVQATLKREVAWSTLLHELVHAALDDAGVVLPEAKEEAICDTVASGMMHVLRPLVAD